MCFKSSFSIPTPLSANSNLAEFAKVLGKPDSPIEKADETALFQIINQLKMCIRDSSHTILSVLKMIHCSPLPCRRLSRPQTTMGLSLIHI